MVMSSRCAALTVLLVVQSVCASGCGNEATKPKVPPIQEWAPTAYLEPTWSPDGLRLGFSHRPLDSIFVDSGGHHHYVFRDSMFGFWMVDSSGANLQRVLSVGLDDPAWSPDGAWIAYGSNADIWKVHTTPTGVDSLSAVRLTFQGIYSGAVWNPSGTALLFYSFGGGNAGLYRLGSGGGAPERVGGAGWRDPYWSPVHTKILFKGQVGGVYGIASADTTGAEPTMIRGDLVLPQLPKWSPDSTMIAFVDRSPATQLQHLWLMKADGSGLRQASPDVVGRGFAWSPDGRYIAYVRHNLLEHAYENGTIWIVDVSNSSLRQLTYNGPQSP